MNLLENNLKAALIQAYDEELSIYEAMAEDTPYDFSDDFVNKMNEGINMSEHRYNAFAGWRIRRSSLGAVAAVLILFLSITVYAAVKGNIPFNIGMQDGPWNLITEGSNDPEIQSSFEYVVPDTPEGFREEARVEEDLSLIIHYLNPAGESIIYAQSFGEGGRAELNFPEGRDMEVTEEIINERNAIITHHGGDIYSITIEDGTSVFVIHGDCGYDILYDMALGVTKID